MITFLVKWENESLTELNECLKLIKAQPTAQYEIIIIDNTGKDRAKELENKKTDLRFQYFMFDAISWKDILISIMNDLSGDFIQIVDVNDRFPIDWCHEAEQNSDHDFIIGYQIYSNNNKLFDFNLCPSKNFDGDTSKAELLKVYYNHGGEDRCLTEINNKVINKNLFQEAVIESKSINVPELYYLCFLNALCLCIASKVTFMNDTAYVYNMTKEKRVFEGKIENIIEDFSSYLSQLEKLIIYNDFDLYAAWKKDWLNEMVNRLHAYHNSDSAEIARIMQNLTNEEIHPNCTTSYFEKLTTELDNSYRYYNDIKKHIASEKCKYVGFDIFDTLIQRPFWEPTDLFCLLNKKYNELINKQTSIDFSLIRKEGERGCRAYFAASFPSREDVTIDEIYDFISQKYGINKNTAETLKKHEIELEKNYCKARKIGRKLFDWAVYCHKNIYIISDMYLPKTVIEEILSRNQYTGYEKLYLSNDAGVSKYSGNLYEYFIKEEKINNPATICFIGDNYEVDFLNSKRYGIIPFHVPKATEIFKGINANIYSGEFFKNTYEPNGSIIDQGSSMKFIGIRSMLAVVANKFFGNPFVSFNRTGDFNADGKFIGYFCAGMFLFSEAHWILKENFNINRTIHFISRDGFFVKEAYDKLKSNKSYAKAAQSNYLYCSRKAIAPLYMAEPEGLFELFLPPHILSNTPNSVINILDKVIKDNINTEEILKKHNIIPFKKFTSLNQYYLFTKVFTEELYDKAKASDYRKTLYEYFEAIIHKDDVIFDVGYSGRMETAFNRLLGFPVNSYYFHEHEPWALMRKGDLNFSIKSFYSFKPCSAFVLREQIFTPNQPSCVGYIKKNQKIEPEFKQYKTMYKEEYVLSLIQKWALTFVDDMVNIFENDLNQMIYNSFDACIPFEYFLHYAKPFDRLIMSAINFEDEFGTNAVLSLYDYWSKEQKTYKLSLHETLPEKEFDYDTIKNQLREEIYREEGIFSDGIFIKFYQKINKLLPVGSRRRNAIKKMINIFH